MGKRRDEKQIDIFGVKKGKEAVVRHCGGVEWGVGWGHSIQQSGVWGGGAVRCLGSE